ncbi:hypothetical protein [Chondromyces apiculatus]|nr:hypothetical protein [Chondromyces apiculatus]
MIASRAARALLPLFFFLGLPGASCGQSALGLMPGVVNNTGNLSLRRAVLTWATQTLCTEVQKRSVPLRLRDEDPSTGRFYPTSCAAQQLPNGNLKVQLGGFGFVWTNLTRRIGFDAAVGVEYEQDFLMEGGVMYVYFRQRETTAATFTTRMIEKPATISVGGISLAPGTAMSDALGAQLLRSEIARGFTVIRGSDASMQLGLGIVEKGQRPPEPYEHGSSQKLLLLNERTEIHQDQRDYIGPLEVTGNDEALSLTLNVDGADGVDVLILPRAPTGPWLQQYATQPVPTPPPEVPRLAEAVPAGAIWRKTVPLPRGFYYLVLDNTAAAGPTQPATQAHDDRAALVSYAVQLGDAP